MRPRPGDSQPLSGRGSPICTRRLDLVISQGLSALKSWLSLLTYSGEGQELQASREKLGKSEAIRPRQTHSQAESLGKQGRAEPQRMSKEQTPGPRDLQTYSRGSGTGGVEARDRQTPRLSPSAPSPVRPATLSSATSLLRIASLALHRPSFAGSGPKGTA